MNKTDAQLQRLYRAAVRSSDSIPVEAPFAFEQCVLDSWRDGLPAEVDPLPGRILRRALVCACAIIVGSLLFTLQALKDPPPNEMAIVDTAIQLTLIP